MRYVFVIIFLASHTFAQVCINNKASLVYNTLIECKSEKLHALLNKENSNKFIEKIINNETNHHSFTKQNLEIIDNAMLEHEKFYDNSTNRLQNTCSKINLIYPTLIFKQINNFFQIQKNFKAYLVPPYLSNNKTTLHVNDIMMIPMSDMPPLYYIQKIIMTITQKCIDSVESMFNNPIRAIIFYIMPLAVIYAITDDNKYVESEYSQTEIKIAKICAIHIKKYLTHNDKFNEKLLQKCEQDILNAYPGILHDPRCLLMYQVTIFANRKTMPHVSSMLRKIYNTKIITNKTHKSPIIVVNDAYNYLPKDLYVKYNQKENEFIHVLFDKNDRMFVFIRCNSIKQINKALLMLKRHGEVKYEYYTKL